MLKYIRTTFRIVFILIALCSCSTKQEVIYLQNMDLAMAYPIEPRRRIVIQENDLLKIIISCRQPELAIPFNSRNVSVGVNANGELTERTNGTDTQSGYRVDINGNIIFPILGKINVVGKFLEQVEDEIRDMLINGDYIKDPQVSVELMNFKITLLGALGSKTVRIDGNRVNLLEAIAMGGDITAKGDISKVYVIRTVDGKSIKVQHDLRDSNIFNSPYFYLHPNDIVYVEPRYRDRDSVSKWTNYVTVFFSTASVITALIALFK